MEFIMNHLGLILALLLGVLLMLGAVYLFVKLPWQTKVSKVKQWLLWAVVEAEKQLGSGTGKLKLRAVYDLFVERFPAVARAVSFDTFAGWVDEALDAVGDVLQGIEEERDRT